MSDAVQVHVTETGQSAFAVRIEMGRFSLIGDEPLEAGGGDLGPVPYQMLIAALGQCTAMTVRWYARQHNWPVEHVAVDVTHEKGAVEGGAGKIDIFRKIVTIKGDSLSDDQRKRLLDVAAKCPVQRTLEGGSQISTVAG